MRHDSGVWHHNVYAPEAVYRPGDHVLDLGLVLDIHLQRQHLRSPLSHLSGDLLGRRNVGDDQVGPRLRKGVRHVPAYAHRATRDDNRLSF